jgi:3-hydroxymyristoyl/3-hydroxydecanoyl-(acyl carrier protein) dehydratase
VSSTGSEPLPHRFPFRLVEQADESGPERVAIVLATANGAATGVGAWPSTLVAEALAQAILVVARPERRGTLRLVGLDNVAVFQPLTPGDRLEVEIHELGTFGALRRYCCRGVRAGGLAAVADVTVAG